MKTCILYFVCLVFLFSCTVTNNLYVNDPVPVQKKNTDLCLGIGTGYRARIDSVTVNGDIVFSDKISMAPNLYLGSQIGLVDRLDLRVSVNLPYIIGGFGARVGPQYSFFSRESKFYMAIGSDLGFVVAKDTLRIFGISTSIETYAKGAINADFFLPVCLNFNNNSRIIITPRYSFNTLFIRRNTEGGKSRRFNPNVPSLAIGLRLNRLYLEASAFRFQNEFFPNFGLVYIIKGNSPGGVDVEL